MRSGRLLPALAIAAALWVVLVSATGAVLSGLGWWTPYAAWPLAALLAAVSGWCVRDLPARSDAGRARDAGDAAPGPAAAGPVGAGVAVLLVVTAFTVWVGATHSEQVLPRRDAASNLQAAVSMAETGHRVVALDAGAFGGPTVLDTAGLTWGSPAFYAVGSGENPSVQPQFVVGPAVVYSFGWWVGGGVGAMLLPAVAMGLALLALGSLVSRMVGPWWGVVAAGVLGVLFPVAHTARATYSEPLAMLALAGGLLALTLVARIPEPVAGSAVGGGRGGVVPRVALVAGVLIGGTGFVRVDALREVVLVLPVIAIGAAMGGRWVRPLAAGLGGSLAVGGLAAVVLSYRYLGDIARSLIPLVALALVVSGGCWAAVALWRRGRRLPARVTAALPNVVGALTILIGLYLASRPLWQVTRQDPDDPGARYVAGMQRREGLLVDGGRTYAEHTVTWLSWYVGPVALVVALLVLAALLRRAVQRVAGGELPGWLPVLVVASGSTLLTLLRPGITPDHPWADRRLLIALPLVVVLDVVAAAWVASRLRERGRAALGHGLAALLVLAVAAPAVVATWPHRSGGVERGSLAAAAEVCASFDEGDVALMVDSRSANEWTQVVRGMCGVPSLAVRTTVRQDPVALASVVDEVAAGVAAGGGRLVLVSADSADALDALDVDAIPVTDRVVREDQHLLERRPDGTDPLPVRVWFGRVGASAP